MFHSFCAYGEWQRTLNGEVRAHRAIGRSQIICLTREDSSHETTFPWRSRGRLQSLLVPGMGANTNQPTSVFRPRWAPILTNRQLRNKPCKLLLRLGRNTEGPCFQSTQPLPCVELLCRTEGLCFPQKKLSHSKRFRVRYPSAKVRTPSALASPQSQLTSNSSPTPSRFRTSRQQGGIAFRSAGNSSRSSAHTSEETYRQSFSSRECAGQGQQCFHAAWSDERVAPCSSASS